jgi:hypothetical protein
MKDRGKRECEADETKGAIDRAVQSGKGYGWLSLLESGGVDLFAQNSCAIVYCANYVRLIAPREYHQELPYRLSTSLLWPLSNKT